MTRSETLSCAAWTLSGLSANVVLSVSETAAAGRALRKVRKILGEPPTERFTTLRLVKTSREDCIRATANTFGLLVLCAGAESLPIVRIETVRAARLVLFLGERLHPLLPEVRKVIFEKLKKIQSFETNCTESVTNATGATN